MKAFNPYEHLLDDPVRLNADEHTEECAQGGGIPWSSDNPSPMFWQPETCSTIRERLRQLQQDLAQHDALMANRDRPLTQQALRHHHSSGNGHQLGEMM